MSSNYEKIIKDNLKKFYEQNTPDLAKAIGAEQNKDFFLFDEKKFLIEAFGRNCEINPDAVLLDNVKQPGPLGVIISLYAINAKNQPLQAEPLLAFKEIKDSAPYSMAFASHAENILVPKVGRIKADFEKIAQKLQGGPGPDNVPGDFSMLVRPLPKIQLCYIFYEADEDFPASVTCLFSNNASIFMPTDGLADVGEYTSRRIFEIAAG